MYNIFGISGRGETGKRRGIRVKPRVFGIFEKDTNLSEPDDMDRKDCYQIKSRGYVSIRVHCW